VAERAVARVVAVPSTPRGQRTRQRILDAAERVFGELGYHQAGIVEITQQAGVALGTFYLYFPDKRAAFEDLVHALNRRLRTEIATAIAGVEDRVEREIVGFETFFRFVDRHRNLYQVIRQAASVDPELVRWHYETLAKGYVSGLRAAQAKGEIAADLDPTTTAYALMGMAESLGMRWMLWDRRFPSAGARRTLRAFLERALRPPKRTAAP
jgi:AcrR family transcriptional regulator